MSAQDWDIFGDVARLRSDLGRIADSLSSHPPTEDEEDVWVPPVDIHEQDDNLILLMDLPGFSREEIDLQVEGETLTLRGERSRTQRGRGIRLERPVGRFIRAFRIGVPIDPSNVQAAYRDGVLEVTIPKLAPDGPTRVRVNLE